VTQLSFEEWHRKQEKTFETPSGLKVSVKLPDYMQLIKDWMDAGVKDPLGKNTKLSKQISKPHVVKKLLLKYVVKPKLTEKQVTILIKEHPTTAQIIYAEIISPFITQADKNIDFFRRYYAWLAGGVSRLNDAKATNRTVESVTSERSPATPNLQRDSVSLRDRLPPESTGKTRDRRREG